MKIDVNRFDVLATSGMSGGQAFAGRRTTYLSGDPVIEYLQIVVDCPMCGRTFDVVKFGTGFLKGLTGRNINEGWTTQPHNTPFCGSTKMRRTTTVIRCPDGVLYVWDDRAK
jgi:ribosomal protein L37AE/L43A